MSRGVDILTVDLRAPFAPVLTSGEEERAAAIVRPEQARRWRAARAALRVALGERLGVAGATLRFNLSHAGDLALIALAPREVGIDVERTDRASRAVERTLCAGERAALDGEDRHVALLRVWCRKEALAKAIGTGLGWAPERFDTSAPGPYALEDVPVPAGYVAALAVAR